MEGAQELIATLSGRRDESKAQGRNSRYSRRAGTMELVRVVRSEVVQWLSAN